MNTIKSFMKIKKYPKKLDAEITAIYKKEIAPLEKKAGGETSFEPLQW